MRRTLILMTLPLFLAAQERFTFTTRMEVSRASGFQAPSRQPTLLVMDDGRNGWTPAFRRLLTEEPLADWSLGQRFLSGKADDQASQETRAKYGWGPEARWAYLVGGAVKATGTTLPTAQALAASLQGAGFQDPTVALAAFCARNPGHAEGQQMLLEAYQARAERYMRRVLPEPQEQARTRTVIMMGAMSASSDVADPEPTRPLTPGEDKLFWTPMEQQLRRLMRHPGWYETRTPLVIPGVARHSAQMKEACRASLGAVEDLLRRYPSHDGLWRTWTSMAHAAGGRSLRSLVGSLEAVPGGRELPPESALPLYVKECREARAWGELKDLMLPRWKDFQTGMAAARQVIKNMGVLLGGQQRDAFKDTWDRTLEPLVEACLRLGDSATADAVVEEALQVFASKNLPMWASQLAMKCGQPQTAQRWASLRAAEGAG